MVFIGSALIVGGIVKILWSPGTEISPAARQSAALARPDGPVNVNTADSSALQSLPGIGPTLAARILSHRQEHGPFTSIEQLARVRGVGPATLARLDTLVTVAASGVLDTSASPALDR